MAARLRAAFSFLYLFGFCCSVILVQSGSSIMDYFKVSNKIRSFYQPIANLLFRLTSKNQYFYVWLFAWLQIPVSMMGVITGVVAQDFFLTFSLSVNIFFADSKSAKSLTYEAKRLSSDESGNINFVSLVLACKYHQWVICSAGAFLFLGLLTSKIYLLFCPTFFAGVTTLAYGFLLCDKPPKKKKEESRQFLATEGV
jgi:hypothetical protein